ncbi:MAG: OB-fold nucleic acid binding domain-containing protein [Actinomycetes bacterium]
MGLASWFDRVSRTTSEVEADELRARSRGLDAIPIANAVRGAPITLAGTIRTVTLRPRTGVPALEAEIYDGSGVATVVWLGRRQLPGVSPGRPIVVKGRVTYRHGRPVVFNPRYELRPYGR